VTSYWWQNVSPNRLVLSFTQEPLGNELQYSLKMLNPVGSSIANCTSQSILLTPEGRLFSYLVRVFGSRGWSILSENGWPFVRSFNPIWCQSLVCPSPAGRFAPVSNTKVFKFYLHVCFFVTEHAQRAANDLNEVLNICKRSSQSHEAEKKVNFSRKTTFLNQNPNPNLFSTLKKTNIKLATFPEILEI